MSSEKTIRLLENIKRKFRQEKKILYKVDCFVDEINNSLKKSNVNAVCVKGGSVAKGTFLKNDYDVDLFVKFGLQYKNKDISGILEKILPVKAVRVHGSRDYFQIKKYGLFFEIVPVLNIKTSYDALNVTDMSPLHVGWVTEKTKKNPLLAGEVRLAKHFCKSAKVYGAESYINGFSGHIIDILVIHYGSFMNLLKAASGWGPKVIIDTEKKLKSPLEELGKDKTRGPLVIVDPVQHSRNAAAALSMEKFERFKKYAKKFLESPSKEFFEIKKLDKKKIKNMQKKSYGGSELFFLEITPIIGKKDVVGSKVLKVFNYFYKALAEKGFEIINCGWELQKKGLVYFILKKGKLSAKVNIKGPPIYKKAHVGEFTRKHPATLTKKGFVFAVEKRKYREAKALLKDVADHEYVRQKVKKIRIVS